MATHYTSVTISSPRLIRQRLKLLAKVFWALVHSYSVAYSSWGYRRPACGGGCLLPVSLLATSHPQGTAYAASANHFVQH